MSWQHRASIVLGTSALGFFLGFMVALGLGCFHRLLTIKTLWLDAWDIWASNFARMSISIDEFCSLRVIFDELLGFPSVSAFLKWGKSFHSLSQCFARIFCLSHILEMKTIIISVFQ